MVRHFAVECAPSTAPASVLPQCPHLSPPFFPDFMDTEGSVSSSIWKGKAKATDLDYEDINSPITYRHLLSNNLGVRDPLRVVALCDSDAFYAACEQVRLGVDPSVPLVVLQWQALIAVNYPARRYGISRMDNINDAKKRCPDLKVVHVATYREGEKEPGYWPDPDTMTHKVCAYIEFIVGS